MIKPVCPHCDVALERRWNKRVFQYFCPSCFGFAVHFGGLKAALGKSEVVRLWSSAEAAPRAKTDCSHCRQPMRQIYQGSMRSIELDVCIYCKLIWLDTGEWQELEKVRGGRESGDPYEEYAKTLLDLDREKHEKKTLAGIALEDVGDMPFWKSAMAVVGVPVEAEENELMATPWVTWLTVGVCILISAWGFANLELAISHFGHSGMREFPRGLITPFTSFFVHGGLFHLLGNMYFLWVFGDNVEDHLGKTKYVALLLAATWIGAMAWAGFNPSANKISLVGASGGVSGLITYYLMRFPRRRFIVFFAFKWISIPGVLFGGLFLLKEIFGAVMETSGRGGGVAHLAHLGGALAGVIFAYFLAPERVLRRGWPVVK